MYVHTCSYYYVLTLQKTILPKKNCVKGGLCYCPIVFFCLNYFFSNVKFVNPFKANIQPNTFYVFNSAIDLFGRRHSHLFSLYDLDILFLLSLLYFLRHAIIINYCSKLFTIAKPEINK